MNVVTICNYPSRFEWKMVRLNGLNKLCGGSLVLYHLSMVAKKKKEKYYFENEVEFMKWNWVTIENERNHVYKGLLIVEVGNLNRLESEWNSTELNQFSIDILSFIKFIKFLKIQIFFNLKEPKSGYYCKK